MGGSNLTGIPNDMIALAPSVSKVTRKVTQFVGKHPVVAHSAGFGKIFWEAGMHVIAVADQFEKLWSRLVFHDKVEDEQLRRRVFGSCFTFQARSDAMWNIYSRNQLGVRVTMQLNELQRQVC